MSNPAPSGLWEALARDARALRADQKAPVDLHLVSRRLGLQLEWGAKRVLPAEGALLQSGSRWTVAVAGADSRWPRNRFTAAHEIGHYILDSYGVPRPTTRGDYWRTEALCHYFAGHLLIPDIGVTWVAAGAGEGPVELLRRSSILSRKALVSPQALSHRLSQDLPYCAFCEIRLESPRKGVIGVVDWIVQRFSWLGLRARNYVHSDHYMAGTLIAQQPLRPDQASNGFLDGLPVAYLRRIRGIWMLAMEPALAAEGQAEVGQLPLPLEGGLAASRDAGTALKSGAPARIAQLVEHFHGKEGVTSSSLVPGFIEAAANSTRAACHGCSAEEEQRPKEPAESLKELLFEMPNVGEDRDFARSEDRRS